MPTIDQNLASWDRGYAWSEQGDEWSRAWGGPDAQWYGCLYPRVRHVLPAKRILEIAPGYGRWTQFLAPLCESLVGVDLSPSCIEFCKQRFAGVDHLSFHVNDGSSLAMVDDGSIDLVFSFDSLVHAEADVMERYLLEIGRVLAPDGRAFIHHSNTGAYRDVIEREASLPEAERAQLKAEGKLLSVHWRAWSMTADLFSQYAKQAGLNCIGQELIQWSRGHYTDAISVVALPGSSYDRPPHVVRNPSFFNEAHSIRLAYSAHGPDASAG